MVKRKREPAEMVTSLPLDQIHPYERNPRTHSQAQVELLARLMIANGVDQPIVVDEHGVIIKGHGRLMAAKVAGMSTFPVVVKRGLSEEQKRAERIADNQVSLLAGWDQELIRIEVGELKLAGWDMSLLGFEDGQLNAFALPFSRGANEVENEWLGMPEFVQPSDKAFRSIIVHFNDQEAVDQFAEVLGIEINERVRFLWYPEVEIKKFVRVESDGTHSAVSDLHRVEGQMGEPVHQQDAGKDEGAVPDRGGGKGAPRVRRSDRRL